MAVTEIEMQGINPHLRETPEKSPKKDDDHTSSGDAMSVLEGFAFLGVELSSLIVACTSCGDPTGVISRVTGGMTLNQCASQVTRPSAVFTGALKRF